MPRRPRFSLRLLAALFFGLLLALTQSACATPTDKAPTLTGTDWQASRIGQQPVKDHAPTLTLDEGRVHGSGSCNRYFGPVGIDHAGIGSLRFSTLATTQMACLPAIAAQETVYLSALDAVRSYRLSGKTLTLLDAAGKPLVEFRPAPQTKR